MMMEKFLKLLIFFMFVVILLTACSHKINKEEMDAQAYFEYAKSLFDKGKYYNAINEFTVITLKFSADPIVDDAQFYLAESHFMYKEYLIAIAEYQKLIEDFPESPYVEEAFYKIGLSYSKLSLRAELDQEYTFQAIRQFQNFLEAYPGSKFRKEAEQKMAELRNKLAQKKLLGGDVYRKMGYLNSALIYYDIVLQEYYDTPAAESALFWKAECEYKLKKMENALTSYTVFLEKYPSSKWASRAKERISEIQESFSRSTADAEGS